MSWWCYSHMVGGLGTGQVTPGTRAGAWMGWAKEFFVLILVFVDVVVVDFVVLFGSRGSH